MSPEEQSRREAMMTHERAARAAGYSLIAGVDEAGRGPLAGPVVAAACILPEGRWIPGIKDSKQMTPRARKKAFQELLSWPDLYFGIGVIDAILIDQINILQATFQAMLIAIAQLPKETDYLLIDGNQAPRTDIPTQPIVGGDKLSASIACASIIAKEVRDALMVYFDERWPVYGFQRHKGYPTDAHCTALQKYGPCPIHRMSFEPLKTGAYAR